LLVAMVIHRQLTGQWVVRVVCIGLGALPAALWFVYVLKHDPVFQARAATETYTENFRSILGGYGLLMLFAGLGGAFWIRSHPQEKKAALGIALFAALAIGLFFLAQSHTSKYWMHMGPWCGLYLVGLVIVALVARPAPAASLFLSWAILGLIAPYFPGLFERKLLMGLGIPWAILGAGGMFLLVRALKENERKLVLGLCAILACATSVRWMGREFELVNQNMSSTTVQPIYLSSDGAKIVDYLNAHVDDRRVVVMAMPGLPVTIENEYVTPLVPDLNPILSGFTGVYTYAGHWSETPHYDESTDVTNQADLPYYLKNRRGTAASFFYSWPLDKRKDFVKQIGADYIVTAVPENVAKLTSGMKTPTHIIDERDLGETVVDGTTLRLIKVN
jgi:arabinosyltransferase C